MNRTDELQKSAQTNPKARGCLSLQCERTFVQLNRKGSCGFVWDGQFIAIAGEHESPEMVGSNWSWYWQLKITNKAALLFEADFSKHIPQGPGVALLEPHTLIFEVA